MAQGRPASRKSSTGKSSIGKSSSGKSSSANRAAGRAPANRPPSRRTGTSIVTQRQTPWGLVVAIATVVVFAVVVLVVVLEQHGSNSAKAGSAAAGAQVVPTTPSGSTTRQQTVKNVKNTSGITGVIAYDTGNWPGNGKDVVGALQHNHVSGPVDYSVTPPAGGPHNATWMNAGVYTVPVPSERAVHNLEHGAVWITYNPDLGASRVAALRAFVARQSLIDESRGSRISGQKSRYMDLTPWASNTLPSPIVVSSWGYQLRLTSATDPRMQKFVDRFRNSATFTPEYGSPVDGEPVSTGGRPAYDGATAPNPG